MSDSVLISIVSAASGIVVTYITVKAKNQGTKPKAKNRIDNAFDEYERIIKRLNEEITRKDVIIESYERERNK